MTTNRPLLKNVLFSRQKIEDLSCLFFKQDATFPKDIFVKNIIADFPELELKQRSTRVCIELEKILTNTYPENLNYLLRALPPALDIKYTDNDYGEFIHVIFSEYIARNGCSLDYVKISLAALVVCTQRFSAEFALRHFLSRFPDQTLTYLSDCVDHDNYHVRRLVSEGTRPSLPWGIGLSLSLDQAIPLLDELFFDSSRYVTRSVANHVNDISKKNPLLAISLLKKWQQSKKQKKQEMDYILKHSLRTLLRQGNQEAFRLLGCTPKPKIKVQNFTLNHTQIVLRESLEVYIEIVSLDNLPQKLMCDLQVLYANPYKEASKKIFKVKNINLEGHTHALFNKKITFKKMTTKKLYPGIHHILLRINGVICSRVDFTLVE